MFRLFLDEHRGDAADEGGRTNTFAAEQDVGLLGEHLLDEFGVLDENHGGARKRNGHDGPVNGEQPPNQPFSGDQITGSAGGGDERAQRLYRPWTRRSIAGKFFDHFDRGSVPFARGRFRVGDVWPPANRPIVETPGSDETVLNTSSLVATSRSSWGR